MLNQLIENQFGIKVERSLSYQGNNAFQAGKYTYLLIPVNHLDIEQLNEMQQLSYFLRARGDSTVAEFVATKAGSLVANIDDEKVVLLKYVFHSYRNRTNIPKDLAILHKTGRSFPQKITKISRIGQWRYLWEKRLGQMELFWRGKLNQHPNNEFEKLFVHSFPYYLGLTENAIQYLVDTELDEQPQQVDSATICHSRITQGVYKDGVKVPTEWVFDHCSRDLADWLRDHYLKHKAVDWSVVQDFLTNYVRVEPLSPFSWRLLYSRLLFPVHFFECIEDYYITGRHDEYVEKLKKMVDSSNEYEQFLSQADELLQTRFTPSNRIPKITWLKKA